jgi:hypothetical protein
LQKYNSHTIRPINRWLILFIPLMTLAVCMAVIIERSPFFSSWSDPTYSYLFNGLNIASGHFKVWHIDHPGTPLQLYAGALIKFFHFFSSDHDIIHDVIARPEWYLFRIGLTSCVMIALCMYIAGAWMLRLTANIFYALIIQLTHIICFPALFFSQNLMSEYILVVTGILLAPLIVAYSFQNKENSRNIIVQAAFITGIMLAGKISSVPIFIMWLMLVKSRKYFFLFIAISAMSFLLFTMPAWHGAKNFFAWLTDNFTHTGNYGSGSKGFAEWNLFFENILSIFKFSWMFTATYFIITLAVIIHFKKIFAKQKDEFANGVRALAAIWLAILLQMVMVAKQFSMHYFIPANLLIVPCWIILLKMFEGSRAVKSFNRNIVVGASVAFAIAIAILATSVSNYSFFPGLIHPGKEMNRMISNLKYDIVLFDNRVTAPLPQPALYFSVGYAGDRSSAYGKVLAQTYSTSYFADISKQTLRDWKKDISPENVLRDSMTVLYCHTLTDAFNINHLQWTDAGFAADSVLFSFTHPVTKESIYLLRIRKTAHAL